MSRPHKNGRKTGTEAARAKLARRILEIEASTENPTEESGEDNWCEIGIAAEVWNELVALAKAGQPPRKAS